MHGCMHAHARGRVRKTEEEAETEGRCAAAAHNQDPAGSGIDLIDCGFFDGLLLLLLWLTGPAPVLALPQTRS